MRRHLALLAIFSAIACTNAVEPVFRRLAFSLETQFESFGTQTFSVARDVSVQDGRVTVTGGIEVNTLCYVVVADVIEMGDTVIAWLTAIRQTWPCLQPVPTIEYRLEIPRGAHVKRIIVHHGVKSSGPPKYEIVRDEMLPPG